MNNHYEEILDELAHEIWAAAQLAPGEGIVDGVDRIVAVLRREGYPAITHCDNCGCDWLDNGLNPVGCPYCKLSAETEALQDCIEQIAQMQPLFDDEDGAIRAALDKAQRAVDKATVGSERGQ